MKILVINGSPKANYSITLQTVLYLEKYFPRQEFTYLNVGAQINLLEKDFSSARTALETADLLLFSYPVYTFIAPSQLHRFIELVKASGIDLSGKYATQITTSKHFYDVTAHRYIQDNCQDLGLKFIRGLSADMDDLLNKKGQVEARKFFSYVLWSIKQKSFEPFPAPRTPAPRIAVTVPQNAASGHKSPSPAAKKVAIVTDCREEDLQLKSMIRRFQAVLPCESHVINIREYPMRGGCLGCFHCASDGKCVYTDGFDRFLREEIQTSDAIVYAFTISDHSMGAVFKCYDDRQFCNGHRTVTMGSPIGYLISGAYSAEPNLQMILEGRSQVGGNFLAGIATDETDPDHEIDRLALTLDYALSHHHTQPQNFYGVGGMKIFRDLIYLMQGMMKADHRFYKAHGQYDFPQKHRGTMLKMYLVGALLSSPKLKEKAGGHINEGMIAPYKKVVEEAKTSLCRKNGETQKGKSLRALFFLLIVFMAAPCVTLQAEEGEDAPTKIGTYEELLQIRNNPQGSYVLMNDIDMAGLQWEPVAFEGVFDGGGHALLNLSVENVGAEQADTYDGNYKVYETYFAGLFSTLKEAEVRNVNLVNLQMELETDVPCFIGGIAGYSENSTVRNCSIQGRLELRAHDRMFGVGGIVGYGNGLIEQTSADVTLICIDTDADTRDEQFMGGAYAAGYLDLNECNVIIDGYDSDHGYVHNGGLVGMYIFYPKGTAHEGRITNNTVQGRIRFFEDNTDRRAYCREYVGETMSWNLKNSDNSAVFERDEVFDYTIDLRPDMCVEASHTETVTEPGCNTFGYTTITCDGCGYAYTDFYTLYRHSVEEWTTIQSPTQFNTGVQNGVCVRCGVVLEEEMPMLEYEEPSTPAETPALTVSAQTDASGEEDSSVAETKNDIMSFLRKPVVIAVATVLILLLVIGEIAVRRGERR